MGRDELKRALNAASDGPERDFTGTWAQGRRVRRRRQAAQGVGVVALAAAVFGGFALGGGLLEDASVEPAPPAEQTLATGEPTGEPTTEATGEAATETGPEPTTEQAADEPTTESPGEETTEATDEATTEERGIGMELPGPDDPLPTSVEGYARVFLLAGLAGDEQVLERMGTDSAVEASVTWTHLAPHLSDPVVSDLGSGEVQVVYATDDPVAASFRLDRATVEAGADHGVLHGEQIDAAPKRTPEEYADVVVGNGLNTGTDLSAVGVYLTTEAEESLSTVPRGGTWERTGSREEGDTVLVSYTNLQTGSELVLILDPAIVEVGEFQGVVGVDTSGVVPGSPTPPAGDLIVRPNPCDQPTPELQVVAGDAGPAALDRAQQLLDLASECDLDGLIALATEQGTTVSFGAASPEEVFSGEEGRQRVHAIASLLVNYPPEVGGGNDGPLGSVQWPQLTQDQWPELIELGIATGADLTGWEDAGRYTGWSLFIEADGQWVTMLADG